LNKNKSKIYLLKDITGSGGGGIYPLLYINNKHYFMNENNVLIDLSDFKKEINIFFIQEFIQPITISGKQIIDYLLKINNFDEILKLIYSTKMSKYLQKKRQIYLVILY
jgi:hypothetical protein